MLRNINVDNLSRRVTQGVHDTFDDVMSDARKLLERDLDMELFMEQLEALKMNTIREVLNMKGRVQDKIMADNKALITRDSGGKIIFLDFK